MSKPKKFFILGNLIYGIGDSAYNPNDLAYSLQDDTGNGDYRGVPLGGTLNRIMMRMYLNSATLLEPNALTYLLDSRLYDCTEFVIYILQPLHNGTFRMMYRVFKRKTPSRWVRKYVSGSFTCDFQPGSAWYLAEEKILPAAIPEDLEVDIKSIPYNPGDSAIFLI